MSEQTDTDQFDASTVAMVEDLLSRLDMVEWDRFTVVEDYHDDTYINLYGWIDRPGDEYKDFVELQCWPDLGDNGIIGFTTSSDEHSEEIHRRLFGEAAGHNDCQRVEHTFDVENAIELDGDDSEQQTLMTDGGTEQTGTDQSDIMRHVVRQPHHGTAGFGVAHVRNPPPHQTEYRVEQLWPDGRAEPVYVGDRDDALELISALTEAIRNE